MQYRRHVIPALILVLIATFPSCTPSHRDDLERIEVLRDRLEKLRMAQAVMAYNNWVYGQQSNTDSLYSANSDLFTKENIELVARTHEENPEQQKRLEYLRRYLISEYVSKRTAGLTDEIANIEAQSTVTIDGRKIAYRDVGPMLRNEPSQSVRARLYQAMDPVLDTLNIRYRAMFDLQRTIAADLGFPSVLGMIATIKGFPLDGLHDMYAGLLRDSDSLYNVLLGHQLQRAFRVGETFRSYDVPRLLRTQEFDRYFPADSLLPLVRETFLGLGVDLDKEPNLRIDSDDRPAKNPRAVCFQISVPSDIRLSIKPSGGYDDLSALLHEMGHGQHYANTTEHALEFRYFGDPTVTETYAFLSEYLLDNQAWLRMHMSMPADALKDFVNFEAFHRLWYVRRYAAKSLYELELYAGDPDAPEHYAVLQSRAAGWEAAPSDRKRYLSDVDANLYSASYLRAWFLEAQLAAHLSKEYGTNWFENPAAGDFLRSLWGYGDRLDGDELARRIGDESINPSVLLGEINRMVLFSRK
jgi:hypothetical protein